MMASILFVFVLSHILMLTMSVMTFVQACRVGIAVYFEALMAYLYMLNRVILPIGPLREFEKD